MEAIGVETGVSLQVIGIFGLAGIAFAVGCLKWIDTRIAKQGDKLAAQILALDERYRTDHLDMVSRVVRLESSRPGDQSQRWPRGHAMNGQ